MRSVAVVFLSALGLAAATTNYTIDVSSVSLSTRSTWCQGQENTCNTLCADSPTANSCDPTTLDYSCLCSNGSAPGLEYYTQTIPTYECNEAYAECIADNPDDAAAQSNCTTQIQDNCGTLDPTTADVSSGTTSSSAAATASATASSSASATAASATSSSTAGAIPTAMVHYGNGAAVVAVGLFAYLL